MAAADVQQHAVDQSLQDEVGVAKNEMQNLTSKVHQINSEAERLAGLFEAMEIHCSCQGTPSHDWSPGTTTRDATSSWDLFEQEVKIEEQELDDTKTTEQQLLTKLEE